MRIEKFHYYLLDQYEQPKATGIGDTNELFNVINGSMDYSSLGRLKGSLEIEIIESEYLNIDYINDRIKVEIEIDKIHYSKGIYLISSSERQISPTQIKRKLTCYSKLKILDNDKVLNAYYLPAGSNIYTAITTLMGDNEYSIDSFTKNTNTDYVAKIGTAKLDIINDLLDIINYESLTVDDDGKFTAKQYVLPSERTTEIYYIEGEPKSSDESNVCRLISGNMTDELDNFDVPNIFVRYTNDVDINPSIVAIYPIQPSNSTLTIDGRSPNVNVEEVADVVDYATLYAKCKRAASDSRSIYSHLEIETAINPKHDYLTCVEVTVGDINYKYIETDWSMNLTHGALMKHTLRRVVDLDE